MISTELVLVAMKIRTFNLATPRTNEEIADAVRQFEDDATLDEIPTGIDELADFIICQRKYWPADKYTGEMKF